MCQRPLKIGSHHPSSLDQSYQISLTIFSPLVPESPDHLGSVLAIGGRGFVGFHVVRHFLLEPTCSSVSVVSRNPKRNGLLNVSYHAANNSDLGAVRDLIRQISPTVIIHAACPSAAAASAKDYESTTVLGTRNLLNVASEVASVKAFIFTSSSTMAAGPEHVDLDEGAPLADTCPGSHPYARTKVQADRMVLEFNEAAKGHESGYAHSVYSSPHHLWRKGLRFRSRNAGVAGNGPDQLSTGRRNEPVELGERR